MDMNYRGECGREGVGRMEWSGGGKWDNCNSIINKYIKEILLTKKNPNIDLFLYSFEGQKSEKDLAGLTLTCQQGRNPSGSSRRECVFVPFLAPRGACIPWLTAPSSSFKARSITFLNVSLTLLPPSYKDP